MNGLSIIEAKTENKNDLIEYLVKYFKDQEPITRSLKLSTDDARIFFTDLVMEGLEYPVSFVVFNERNEIIGCRLNTIYEKNINHYQLDISLYPTGPKRIVQLLDNLTEGFEKLLPYFTKIMKFVTVSVRHDYQRRGIAERLVNLSMEKARSLNCDHIMVTATAIRSQKMFEKLGFKAIKEISYDEFLDENGCKIFNCDDGTNSSKLMIKKL